MDAVNASQAGRVFTAIRLVQVGSLAKNVNNFAPVKMGLPATTSQVRNNN